MSDESTSAGPMLGKIEFIENHRPNLPSGDYDITVSQSITTKEVLEKATEPQATPKKKREAVTDTFASKTRKFAVQGPRFALEPQLIRAVFPPAGSLGEHSSVLPHISFTRSTLPWERFAQPKDLKTPWLALLMFDQDELVEKETIEVETTAIDGERETVGGPKSIVVEGELSAGKVSGPKSCTLLQVGDHWTLNPGARASTPPGLLSPTFPAESGQQDGDPVTVIDVARDLLEIILPSLEDVQLLGHVRQATDDAATRVGDPVATILANRLPRPGSMSVVHLVSLEGRYGSEQNDLWNLPPGKFVRLVSLKSWRFTCLDEKHSFKGLLHHLNQDALRLQTDHLSAAREFVEQGLVAMPHEMRQGNRSVSWYRGPLAPGPVAEVSERQMDSPEDSERPRSADQLVRYDPANGMFDVSYAAAWELGRLLTLQNEKVAVSLLDWKRRHRHSQERLTAMRALEHLPVVGRPATPDLPVDVTQWFADLALLLGVPFNYLVPDERMLPQESIRFFCVDPQWIRCIHDGAFSIGRVLSSDHERDAAHHPDQLHKLHAKVTGFLLRSQVVSGWPDLQVDGYHEFVLHKRYELDVKAPSSPLEERVPFDHLLQAAMNNGDASALDSTFGFSAKTGIEISPIVANSSWLVNVNENETLYRIDRTGDEFRLSIENRLPMLRMERLSANVLLCMFAGDIQTVDIHQKPEALHFGFDRSADVPGNYSKTLRSHIGGELSDCNVTPLEWKKGHADKRVILIESLNQDIKEKLQLFAGFDPATGKWHPSRELEKAAISAVGEAGAQAFVAKFKETANRANSAQFALQMTEGVQKVRFVQTAQTPGAPGLLTPKTDQLNV